MEEQKQYSVFDDVPVARPVHELGSMHTLIYYVFTAYFVIKAFVRWGLFISFRNFAIAHHEPVITHVSLSFLIFTACTSLVTGGSIALFLRSNYRGAIALLILGALMELSIFYL